MHHEARQKGSSTRWKVIGWGKYRSSGLILASGLLLLIPTSRMEEVRLLRGRHGGRRRGLLGSNSSAKWTKLQKRRQTEGRE